MSKTITAKVNAVYNENVVYLNVGKEESVKIPSSSFKHLPMQGEVLELTGYSEFEMKNRKGLFANFSNCKYLSRVEQTVEAAESTVVEEAPIF